MTLFRSAIGSLTGLAAVLSIAAVQAAEGSNPNTAGTSTSSELPAPAPRSTASSSTAFDSAFDGYRSYTEEPVASWRDANDQVREIGGWRAYAREAQAPAAAAAPAKPQTRESDAISGDAGGKQQ